MKKSNSKFPIMVFWMTASLAQGNWVGVACGEQFARQCLTDVTAESKQPASAPILLTVTIKNTGKQPVRYPLLMGKGEYPNAGWFKAKITDSVGDVQEAEMSNDLSDGGGGSGGLSQILPGQSIEMPAAILAMPAGVYKIQVREGRITQVTIKDDKELARKRTQEMLARIRKGDAFAQHVAGRYPTDELTEALCQELFSDDIQAANRAAIPLDRLQRLPPKSLEYIKKAMDKQLDLAKQGRLSQTGILSTLAYLASRIGSDEALEPVLSLAKTEGLGNAAIGALGTFKQEKAAKELHRFLNDDNEEIQLRAAQALARRNDPGALEILLIVGNNPKNRWRQFAIQELPKYSDDPRVEAAIKHSLDDPDSQVRKSAEFALRQLANKKKQKP
jgi:hypothetical protein